MNGWLVAADLLLAAGFTARLTRFVITDDLGRWWIRDPIDAWFHKPASVKLADGSKVAADQVTTVGGWGSPSPEVWPPVRRRMRWHRYLSGLVCPFCIGWWLALAVLTSLMLVGGPGDAATWWRFVAGVFTLNWIVAHVGVRLGDAGYSDDD